MLMRLAIPMTLCRSLSAVRAESETNVRGDIAHSIVRLRLRSVIIGGAFADVDLVALSPTGLLLHLKNFPLL